MTPKLPFPVHFLGSINDEKLLNLLYSSVDVVALPSLQDNLPNIGLEALSSGTPLISFDIGGLSDIGKHYVTGYLATPLDPKDFANGICWTLDNSNKVRLRHQCRYYCESHFSFKSCVDAYSDIYSSTIKKFFSHS